jgi:hypothetical protein
MSVFAVIGIIILFTILIIGLLYIFNPDIFKLDINKNNQSTTSNASSSMNIPSISSINNANNNSSSNNPVSPVITIIPNSVTPNNPVTSNTITTPNNPVTSNTITTPNNPVTPNNIGGQDNIDRLVSNYIDYVDFINTSPYGVGYGNPALIKAYADKSINDKFIGIDIETYKGTLSKCKDRCKRIESKTPLNISSYPKMFRYREKDTNKEVQFCDNPNDKVIKINSARIGVTESNAPYNDTGEWANDKKLNDKFLENILGNSSHTFSDLYMAGPDGQDLFPNKAKVLEVKYECAPFGAFRFRESDAIKNIKLCKDNQKVIKMSNIRIGKVKDANGYEVSDWTIDSLNENIKNDIIGKNYYYLPNNLSTAGSDGGDIYKNYTKVLKFNYDCGVDSCGGFARKKNILDSDENGECYLKGPIPKLQNGSYIFNFKDEKNEYNNWIKDRQKIGDVIKGMYGDDLNFTIKAV